MLNAALVLGLVALSSCQISESGADVKKTAAPAKTAFKVGDAVDAMWTDGRWYEATITAAGKTYDVKYADGSDGEKLAASKVRAIVEGGPYKVGDRAEAVYSDSGLYGATIISVTDDTYGVLSDDGSTWDKLTTKKLRPAAAKPLKVGTKIWGQWTDGSWYAGKITALNKDGTFKVVYDDGDGSPALTKAQIGWRQEVKATASSGDGGGNCAGPGMPRRCNGVCTTIQDNDNNCGGCGEICNAGFHCEGLFCRDGAGNLGSSHRK